MCAKVKMLTAIDVLVNCTLVLKKHKYSNCIQKNSFSLQVMNINVTPAHHHRASLENLTKYVMAFKSLTMCMATSLQKQPGSVLPLAESSGQLFDSILLVLQDIFCYNFNLVLNTPLTAANSTPVSSAFFTSKDYLLWSGSEQEYKTRKGNIVGRLLAVFKYPTNPNMNSWGFMNKLTGGQ